MAAPHAGKWREQNREGLPPDPLEKPGWVLTAHDEFDGPESNPERLVMDDLGDRPSAFWTVGVRDENWQEGEIYIFEHYREPSLAMFNLFPWKDRGIKHVSKKHKLDFDPTAGFNIYALEWDEHSIEKYVNNERVATIGLSPPCSRRIRLEYVWACRLEWRGRHSLGLRLTQGIYPRLFPGV